jgi:hypothetical protein
MATKTKDGLGWVGTLALYTYLFKVRSYAFAAKCVRAWDHRDGSVQKLAADRTAHLMFQLSERLVQGIGSIQRGSHPDVFIVHGSSPFLNR